MAFVVSAVTAVSAAIAVTTVATVATAITYVGLAMTVVGTVTKSKELVKIGGILSLAGGVTSLANSAIGALGSSAAAGAAGTASELGAESLWADAASQATADASANAALEAGQAVTADSFSGAASSAADKIVGGAGGSLAGVGDSALGEAAKSTLESGATGFAPPTPVSPTTAAEAVKPSGLVNQSLDSKLGSTDWLSDIPKPKPGLLSDPVEWFKALTPEQQTKVGTSLLQTGGQALGGLFQGWTADQKLALEREAQNLSKQKYDDSVKNANAMPVIAFKPVGSGLVNNAMKGG